ncbi:MAG TPA: hypothetical protein VH300_05390 [Thermoleophilaceae bacterium]|nr:hypothetical protein [Thermoleophilaceae bacterium]
MSVETKAVGSETVGAEATGLAGRTRRGDAAIWSGDHWGTV